MKLVFSLLFAFLLISSCQEQQKIAYVDNGKVINEYQEKLDIEEKYKVRDEVFSKRADSIGQAFQLEAQDMQIKARKMSQQKAQEVYDELGQKQQLLQQQLQFEQQQLQQAFNSEIDSAIIKVKDFVKAYGERNGYKLILGTTDAASTVMFGTAEDDLTQIVLDSLNAGYKKD
ncbi:MAG: OmpH family outer membrane protein [Flavobacteriaceae bacterium]|nr:OmpH family outer membrane protein [Flavobacteriaceae bacterium]